MIDLAKFIGNAEIFPILNHWDFYNHAGASPLPAPVAKVMRDYVHETEQNAYLFGNRYAEPDVIRKIAAQMIDAESGDEVAMLKNTAEGLSIVAQSIEWKPGDRIVTAAGEYPANVYPWMEQSRRGAELVFVPEVEHDDGTREVPLDSILREAAHPRTRVVTLSHVEFATGQRHDIAAIGKFCRENGKLFVVDAIQSLGALPVSVRDANIDYLAAGGQKWMLAAEGAAIFYCRRELMDRTRPLLIGAVSVENATAFSEYDYTFAKNARRYESGTYNIVGFRAMRAAMEMLMELGANAISHRIKTITERLIEGLRAKSYTVASPRDGEQWSGIVSFSSRSGDHDQIVRTLRREQKTELVVRGGRLRAAPHFYNTEEQIDRLIERLP